MAIVQFILIVLICGFLYAIKGGSGASLFKNWNYVRGKNKLLDRLLDGKTASTLGMIVMAIILTGDVYYALALPVAWLLAVAPSMGEEHGAIGDYKEWWGPYRLKQFGRDYGIKKGIQRGVFMGALFTLVTGFTPFILFSGLFVPLVWMGQSLNRLILKEPGWTLAEPLIGAFVVGVPLALWVG